MIKVLILKLKFKLNFASQKKIINVFFFKLKNEIFFPLALVCNPCERRDVSL
jgi:hypothetical protein